MICFSANNNGSNCRIVKAESILSRFTQNIKIEFSVELHSMNDKFIHMIYI